MSTCGRGPGPGDDPHLAKPSRGQPLDGEQFGGERRGVRASGVDSIQAAEL